VPALYNILLQYASIKCLLKTPYRVSFCRYLLEGSAECDSSSHGGRVLGQINWKNVNVISERPHKKFQYDVNTANTENGYLKDRKSVNKSHKISIFS